jgi:NADH-quinone oxidoreductase subunit E
VLDDELRAKADEIVAKYPNSRSATLPLLFLVQSVEGYITEAGMREVAEILGLTPAQVLATSSFYTMLRQVPQGDYLISVCRNITCTHMGSRDVASKAEERLGVAVGDTTADGKFTLETAECLATCDGAPSLQVNYEDFYNVTPEGVAEIIDKLERGEEVKSVRGETVRTSKQIYYETAVAGIHRPMGEHMDARTVGGEIPRADMAPGIRPKELGDDDIDAEEVAPASSERQEEMESRTTEDVNDA